MDKIKIITIVLLLGMYSSFIDTENKCLKSHKCRECYQDNCITCNRSFMTKSLTCEDPRSFISNCETYNSDSKCILCSHGFYLKEGSCLPCKEQGCAFCTEDKCQVCFDFKINNGKCSQQERCSEENCELCNEKDLCMQCKKGYSIATDLEEGKIICKKSKGNCFISDTTTGIERCINCRLGEYLTEEGICKSIKTIGIMMISSLLTVF